MAWYQFIKDITLSYKNRKIQELRSVLKERLLRYFEDGQRNVNGSFSASWDELLKSNLFKAEHFDIAKEMLTELVNKGFLEYDGGRYFLKGHVPTF